jgi:hypothetical protein
MDELEKTLEDLENEVMEELDGNPMKAYKIQFPYSVTFSLSDDDHHTQVIINTTSQEMTFARSGQDALYQKEKNDAVSKNGYTNHIINWVQTRMSPNDTCELTYTNSPTVEEMTEEEIETYEREVISID